MKRLLPDRALNAIEQRAWLLRIAWPPIRFHSGRLAWLTDSVRAPWPAAQSRPALSAPSTDTTTEFVFVSTPQPVTDAGALATWLSSDDLSASSCAVLRCTTRAVAPAAWI